MKTGKYRKPGNLHMFLIIYRIDICIPAFVIDISDVIEKKIESIKAYGTQFYNPGNDEPETYISTPDFLDSIIYRSKMLGKMIGVKYAEGFISKKMIGFVNFNALIANIT